MESKVFDLIKKEEERQDSNIELIASENFVSENIMKAVGSCLTNKYAEGYPWHRYYGGCRVVDEVEEYCQRQWQKVFNTDYHVNVQPHSGSQANAAAFTSVLNPGDTILTMSLDKGGHLTHGSPVNFSGKTYNVIHYGVTDDGYIDLIDVQRKAELCRPKLILAGASAYSREIDYVMFSIIAKSVGAYLMVDMAHVAGLIAAGEHISPFDYADIITTTTHKTLRGPRGGLIFCTDELAKKVDSAIFPGTQGGPLMHVIAGKAVCADEALTPEYKRYIRQAVANSKAMAIKFKELGYDIVTGGTDNHMFLIDLSKTHPHLTGKDVQDYFEEYDITLNKNCVPNEQRSPTLTSGIRIGTPAMTTKGWKEGDFMSTAVIMDTLIKKM